MFFYFWRGFLFKVNYQRRVPFFVHGNLVWFGGPFDKPWQFPGATKIWLSALWAANSPAYSARKNLKASSCRSVAGSNVGFVFLLGYLFLWLCQGNQEEPPI